MADYGFKSEKQRKLAEEEVDAKAEDNFEDSRGNIVSFDDGTEWLIYDSYDEAERACVEYVGEMLEDEPELFEQNWLQQHTSFSETDRSMMADDLVGEYPNEIRDEDDGHRLAEEADVLDELDELEDKIDEYEEKDKDASKLEDKKEILLDEAEETVRQKMYDDYYDCLEDPFDCLVNVQGIYSADDFWEHFKYAINVDEAADDAVNTDGIAHFFASYDGNEVELDDGTVMYRVN